MISRILIVEDHMLVREGLKMLISLDPTLEVIGETGDCERAVALARENRPDLVLLDLDLPKCKGTNLIAQLKSQSASVKILILTGSLQAEDVDRALAAGANGYVVKQEDSKELLRAMPLILAGGYYVSKLVAEAARNCMHRGWSNESLTARERQILKAISQGKTSQQIADHMFLSVHTVRTHRQNLMQKLNLHNVAELTAWAMRNIPTGA